MLALVLQLQLWRINFGCSSMDVDGWRERLRQQHSLADAVLVLSSVLNQHVLKYGGWQWLASSKWYLLGYLTLS